MVLVVGKQGKWNERVRVAAAATEAETQAMASVRLWLGGGTITT